MYETALWGVCVLEARPIKGTAPRIKVSFCPCSHVSDCPVVYMCACVLEARPIKGTAPREKVSFCPYSHV
eukprot:355423-Pelagomonas_calceolata.AAC.3